jgi:hypothetical protein
MHTRSRALIHTSASLLKALLIGGGAVIAALAIASRADATSNLCDATGECARDLTESSYESQDYRFAAGLQRGVGPEYGLRSVELSDQDFSTFSGVGMISCTVDGATRSATAFLVGAFDIGVTVAHMFEKDVSGAMPTDCFYNSMDSLGQVRERIPVSYVKSQWEAEADAFGQPAKDLAVVRLSSPSRYAQKTMPLGRFSGDAAPVVMVGYRIDLVADTMKHKARGTVYERRADGLVVSSVAGFVHDMDARGIAPGAPVIDERTGVIIGIHTRLPAKRNAMITMNDWLEATLRTEIQTPSQATPN